MKTRIIKTVFHGAIPSEGLISLTIPNAKWESVTPFATFEFDEIG